MTFSELVAKVEAAFPLPAEIVIQPHYSRYVYSDGEVTRKLEWEAMVPCHATGQREWILSQPTPEALWIKIQSWLPPVEVKLDLSLVDAESMAQS